MAWIESHQNLEEHPKILFLCQKTGWNIDEAIGKLHRLWWWALKYSEDGDLGKYDPSQFLVRLNSKLNPQELYKILQEANFIEKNGLIHDWLDYAGRYLTTKYRTSNPNKLRMIEKKYQSVKSRTKVRLKSDTLPTLPTNLPNQPDPKIISLEIYNHYEKQIKPGAQEDALRSIHKLLTEGKTKEELIGRINSYKAQLIKDNKQDKTFWIQANNFFGRQARYKDYEPKIEKLKPVDPNCSICKGTGFEFVPAESANRVCRCRIIKSTITKKDEVKQ